MRDFCFMYRGISEIENGIKDGIQRAQEADKALRAVIENRNVKRSIIMQAVSNLVLKYGTRYREFIKGLPIVGSAAKRIYWRLVRRKYY